MARIERRIQITSQHDDLLIEFFEKGDRHWNLEYHMWIDGEALTTVRILGVMRAWIEHDDANFNHPLLTISE